MALIFDEQFEAAGYDETVAGNGSDWGEVNAGGGTIDEDFVVSTVESLTGLNLPTWNSQCLKLAGGTSEVRIASTLDTNYTDLYVRFDLIINDASGLTNGEQKVLFQSWDNLWANSIGFILYRHTDSNLYIQFGRTIDPSIVPAWPGYGPISLNVKYRIDFHFVASGTCEGKIDGVSQGTFTSSGIDVRRFSLYKPVLAASADGTAFFDNIQLATDGWIPDDDPHKGVTMRFIQSYIPPV